MIGFYKMSPGKVIVALSILIVAKALPLQEDGVGVSESTKEQINYRLPDNIRPFHYDVRLTPHMTGSNFTFDGYIAIGIEIRAATHDITLHAYKLQIAEVSTWLVKKSFADLSLRSPSSHNYDDETQMLTIRFDETLEPDMYYLHMKFSGTSNDELKGLYRSSYTDANGDETWMVVTHFEPSNARRVFPCFDEPALKATFNISVQHYANYTALSNMPVASRTPANDKAGQVLTRFQSTPVMSTYLVALVVGDFVKVPSNDGVNNVWVRKNVNGDGLLNLAVATVATLAFEAYANTSFRVPKMDHVAVVQYPTGAMENWGLIIYPEGSLVYNSSWDTSRKMRVKEVAIHELAHQWFGNLVSPSWWSYAWLNEAFAAYFQRYIVDQIIHPRWMDYFVVTSQHNTLEDDSTSDTQPITVNVVTPSDAATAFSSITYAKGASILRMTSHFLSENVFRNGLVKYLDTFQYKAASPSDLWSTIQSVLDQSDVIHDEFTVAETMNTWTDQVGYPLVNVHRDYDTGRVTLTQQIFRPRHYTFAYDEDDDANRENDTDTQRTEDIDVESNKWWIPISYTTQADTDFSRTLPRVWMKPHEDNATIDGINDSDWIILNLQQTGFYRVNYDTANWRKIASYLNSDDYGNIHPLNRAQILDDTFVLLKAGLLDPAVYIEVTNYLHRENDIIPWIPVFRVLDAFQLYIQHPAVAYILKPHILELMTALIESIGFEEHPDDNDIIKMHRDSVITWACMMGSSACKSKTFEKTIAYWRDPKQNNIPKDLKFVVLCEGFREINESVWSDFASGSSERGEFDMPGITCAENNVVIKWAVDMIMKQNSTASSEDLESTISMQLPSSYSAGNIIMDYVLENCNKVENMNSNSATLQMLVKIVITKNVHTTEQLNKARTLVRTCDIHLDEDILNAVASKMRKVDQEISVLQSWFLETLEQLKP